MLGGFLLLRRAMLDELGGFDAGFRMYGEDIDLCYRAAKAGWERWYVPAGGRPPRWDALTDRKLFTRRTLWHWRAVLRFVRKHPERLLGAMSDVRRGERWTEREYADPVAVPRATAPSWSSRSGRGSSPATASRPRLRRRRPRRLPARDRVPRRRRDPRDGRRGAAARGASSRTPT